MAVYMGGGPSLMYAANAVEAFEEYSASRCAFRHAGSRFGGLSFRPRRREIRHKPASRKRLQHVGRRARFDFDRRPRFGKRHDHLARQQLQRQIRARAIDRIAEDRPAL